MLGTRERIAVVEFEGRRLLVGVTPQQISLLCELDRVGFAGSLGLASTQPGGATQGGEAQAAMSTLSAGGQRSQGPDSRPTGSGLSQQ
jgi:flagellar biogenesis protein FliO